MNLREQLANVETPLAIFIISFFVVMLTIGYWITWPVEAFPELWRTLCVVRIAAMCISFVLFGLYIAHNLLPNLLYGVVPAIAFALLLLLNPLQDLFSGEQTRRPEKVEFRYHSFFNSSSRYNNSMYNKLFAEFRFADGKTFEVEAAAFETHRQRCRNNGQSVETITYLAGLERLLTATCAGAGEPADVDAFNKSQSLCIDPGDAVSCYRAGRALEKGLGTGVNPAKAKEMYRRACELGFTEVCVKVSAPGR